jgi:hypothetical protein
VCRLLQPRRAPNNVTSELPRHLGRIAKASGMAHLRVADYTGVRSWSGENGIMRDHPAFLATGGIRLHEQGPHQKENHTVSILYVTSCKRKLDWHV